jgi:energy-coupling factor transporter ATP-binding protein EcfA2
VALAALDHVTYAYPGVGDVALVDVSLELGVGEVVAVLGPSGAGKSTLLRALAGLVPHFHGGRFAGRVTVGGLDTRRVRPADLAGTVATVFQDPEDQVVMARVRNEVAFGLENIGTLPGEIWARVDDALDAVDAGRLGRRPTGELSSGELQRVCLASALALKPALLLLDEPTSQLDPEGADEFMSALESLDATIVLSEQRTARALALADRVLFLEGGRLLLDARREEALDWLAARRLQYLPEHGDPELPTAAAEGIVGRLEGVTFSYRPGQPVLNAVDLELRRGEILVLEGPNGSGKTTLAKIAAGLLEPGSGRVWRTGRAGYLSQDPGRYLVRERVLDEVALAVDGDRERAWLALAAVGLEWAADRHPRDLSSGERERLGLAAVTVASPDLLVLDEPTRGVDPDRKAALADWLLAYVRGGRAVLVATHDRTFPAHSRVDLGQETFVDA